MEKGCESVTEPFFRLLDAASSVTEPVSEIVNSVDGWVWFGRIADFAGITSLLISFFTLINARKAKSVIIEYASDFNRDIEELSILFNSISKDDIYNEHILTAVSLQLNKILIYYGRNLKFYRKNIRTLISDIDTTIEQLPDIPDYNKTKITKDIQTISIELWKIAVEVTKKHEE